MTCIVGLEHESGVLIGGDSAGISGWSLTVRADPKVFVRDAYAIGFTTSYRMGQLLRYAGDLPVPPFDVDELDAFMVTVFVNAIRNIFKEGGYVKVENSREEAGTFLVGVAGRLYSIEDGFQVARSADGYMACGSGNVAALGSLYTTARDSFTFTNDVAAAQHRVRTALAAAEALNIGVAGPFVVVEAP